MEPPLELFLVTAPPEAAETLARALVEERLAACVNVVPGLVSIYRWQGAVQREAEVLLLIKTRPELAAALAARVRALHPYDCPEIVHAPLAVANPDYARWLAEETKPAAPNAPERP